MIVVGSKVRISAAGREREERNRTQELARESKDDRRRRLDVERRQREEPERERLEREKLARRHESEKADADAAAAAEPASAARRSRVKEVKSRHAEEVQALERALLDRRHKKTARGLPADQVYEVMKLKGDRAWVEDRATKIVRIVLVSELAEA